MKATFALLADCDIQNQAAKLMLKAHQVAGTGFEMTRLPFHISLKQPFQIDNLDKLEDYFDTFVQTIPSIHVAFNKVSICPSNVFGYDSGVLALQVAESIELCQIQEKFNDSLYERFGPCPSEHDDDYIFHMTLAIGGGSYDSYEKAKECLDGYELRIKGMFSELALFYYLEDEIRPGTYFCYKKEPLK